MKNLRIKILAFFAEFLITFLIVAVGAILIITLVIILHRYNISAGGFLIFLFLVLLASYFLYVKRSKIMTSKEKFIGTMRGGKAILVVFLVLGFLFYWYEYRPATIRKKCSEFPAGYNANVKIPASDAKYKECLRINGLEK